MDRRRTGPALVQTGHNWTTTGPVLTLDLTAVLSSPGPVADPVSVLLHGIGPVRVLGPGPRILASGPDQDRTLKVYQCFSHTLLKQIGLGMTVFCCSFKLRSGFEFQRIR